MFSLGSKSGSRKDWVTQVTELIESVVDMIRDKAVVPLMTVARAIVYGLLAAAVGSIALVVLAIALVRLLDVYLDNIPGVPENVWFAYLVGGAIFVIAGLLMWMKRKPKEASN